MSSWCNSSIRLVGFQSPVIIQYISSHYYNTLATISNMQCILWIAKKHKTFRCSYTSKYCSRVLLNIECSHLILQTEKIMDLPKCTRNLPEHFGRSQTAMDVGPHCVAQIARLSSWTTSMANIQTPIVTSSLMNMRYLQQGDSSNIH